MSALILGVKTIILIITIRTPYYFRSQFISLIKLKIGYAILSQFEARMEPISGFNLKKNERREIIFCVVWMISLIDKAFDVGILSPKDFRKFILHKKTTRDPLTIELSGLINHIEKLAQNNPFYDKFLDNIIKTWETHSIRDVIPGQNKVSPEEALIAAENRGGSYFLALTYILNPINLSMETERVVNSSGAWFQIIDDYRDRKSDIGNKNTLFTTNDANPNNILKRYTRKYSSENPPSLNKFMQNLTDLTLLIDWIPLDWK